MILKVLLAMIVYLKSSDNELVISMAIKTNHDESNNNKLLHRASLTERKHLAIFMLFLGSFKIVSIS